MNGTFANRLRPRLQGLQRCGHGFLAVTLLVAGCDGAGRRTHHDTVTLAAAHAGNPTVAVDVQTGTRYAAWIETYDSAADVYLSRDAGEGHSSVVRVNDIPGDAASHDQAPPQVAVGPEGNVYVVWQNNTPVPGRRFPASNLRLARSTDGGRTFERAIFVNDDAAGPPSSHTFHDVAVADDGTVHVSWIDGRERTRAELARAADANDPSYTSHTSRTSHAHHAQAADALPGSEVRVARSTDGGRGFGASVVVAADVCPCCRTSIVADGAGRVFVSYRDRTDNIRSIAVARSRDGGLTFAPPRIVHDDGWTIDGCPHAGASLALTADGRLHVAWYTGALDRQGIWYAVSADDAETFGAPLPVQTGGWVPVSQVKLGAAPDGTMWLAWDDRRAEQPAVLVARVGARGVEPVVQSVRGEHPAISAARGVLLAWQTRGGAAQLLQVEAATEPPRVTRAD